LFGSLRHIGLLRFNKNKRGQAYAAVVVVAQAKWLLCVILVLNIWKTDVVSSAPSGSGKFHTKSS
jgi:hypothetical protein